MRFINSDNQFYGINSLNDSGVLHYNTRYDTYNLTVTFNDTSLSIKANTTFSGRFAIMIFY